MKRTFDNSSLDADNFATANDHHMDTMDTDEPNAYQVAMKKGT